MEYFVGKTISIVQQTGSIGKMRIIFPEIAFNALAGLLSVQVSSFS